MYLQVETRTSSRLHLKRAPGIRSWSLLVGILSIGLAAAYYSGDSLGWKLFYVTGCLFVAVQNLEDWEEAIFDKSTGKVVLKTFSLYKKLLTLFRAGHDQVVVLLHDVRDVSVEEEKVRYFGKGYMVVLRLATGFSHPLTQSAVMGHRSDVEAIAKLITSFLELHCLESPGMPEPVHHPQDPWHIPGVPEPVHSPQNSVALASVGASSRVGLLPAHTAAFTLHETAGRTRTPRLSPS
uniref:Essential for reactive oxygen species protein n=1 Tax=Macaca fascicularis TaxID=9541 RepID=A0A2K5TQU9_MACFA